MVLEEEVSSVAKDLKGHVSEGAILSTCNRTEVYATVPEQAAGLIAVKDFLARSSGLAVEGLEPFLYTHSQEHAVRHLFAVASGIDSLILGESGILWQVRDALVRSSEAGMVAIPLSRLFHSALRTGRLAREQTAISRHAASVSSAGVQMARKVFGGLEQCKVLVISAGEAGSLTARCLRDAGALEIGVANRTMARAVDLATELGGRTVDFDDIPRRLVDFDVVISATASSGYVIYKDSVARAMDARGGRPLCLIDIAVPRDIDPESRNVANVYLYDIDDLEAVSLSGMRERQNAVANVQRIVDEETGRFMQWFDTLEATPVIRALHEKTEHIRERELRKTMTKLGHLSPQDQSHIEALTKALASKLLHDPITSLKGQAQAGNIDAARRLFRLDAEDPRSPLP
ncbi:MAG: glutamyl-tRNA reductase [Dehalococcoidia bacterium]|nr:glutamyl-tRNA reductase [Dehalococcoidia bacterium]